MRRRWVQIDGELVEVTADYVQAPRASTDSVLWNDRAYQDMGDPRFNSRSSHREFMARNGLTTADDFHGEWKRSENERARFFTEGYDPSRKRDVIEAVNNPRSGLSRTTIIPKE